MTLQSEISELRDAWLDLWFTIAHESGLIRLCGRLGMKPRPWVLEREERLAEAREDEQ